MIRLPEKYIARMKATLCAEFDDYLAALSAPPTKGLHINTLKCDESAVGWADLERVSGNCRRVLSGAPARHPYYAAGLYYMQEPSAMLPVQALGDIAGLKVLDMCAAPGGKSSQLAIKLAGRGLLVANETEGSRALILRENITRMGYTNVVITSMRPSDVADTFGGAFDVVVVDAPCSGEGMMRKEPEAALGWSEANVRACAARQREILSSADRCLKEGGLLLYSTCTFAEEEDEANVRFISDLGYTVLPIPEEIAKLGSAAGGGVKFFPHKFGGEGQFFALLRKDSAGERAARLNRPYQAATAAEAADVRKVVDIEGRIVRKNDMLFLPALDFDLPCLANGVLLGRRVKDRFEPSHSLFTALGRAVRSRLDLPLGDERIAAYLAGEEIEGNAIGYCTITVDGYPLGGGKGSGGVIKNHYPKFLRIR